MKIEHRAIHLSSFDIKSVRKDGILRGRNRGLRINTEQLKFLEMMNEGKSVYDLVLQHYDKGHYVSFLALSDLLRFMVEEKIIADDRFQEYFFAKAEEPKGTLETFKDIVLGPAPLKIDVEKELQALPFFRSMDPDIVAKFIEHGRTLKVPPHISVCQTGAQTRNLYVLIKGMASVYVKRNGIRQKVATLNEKSIFGEVGFFLGDTRTADVVTDEDSIILQIQYNAQVFDPIIKARAKDLYMRILVIRALLQSETFREIPADCFDTLAFAGRLKNFDPDHLLCEEGDRGTTCYLIIDGKVKVTQHGKYIRSLGVGNCFGEMALLMFSGMRTATVEAESKVLALEFSQGPFYRLLADNLAIACEFEKIAQSRLNSDSRRKRA
jgi:CRP-like cAMP-binding protein